MIGRVMVLATCIAREQWARIQHRFKGSRVFRKMYRHRRWKTILAYTHDGVAGSGKPVVTLAQFRQFAKRCCWQKKGDRIEILSCLRALTYLKDYVGNFGMIIGKCGIPFVNCH